MLSDTRRNSITCHTRHTTRHNTLHFFNSTFKWNRTRQTRPTLFFWYICNICIYIYIYMLQSDQLLYIATGKSVSQYCLFQLRIRTAVLKYGGQINIIFLKNFQSTVQPFATTQESSHLLRECSWITLMQVFFE